MPNWCANAVVITATEHEGAQMIRRLNNHLEENGGLMSFFLPIPPELNDPRTGSFGGENADEKDALRESLLEKYGYSGWYDWCLAEWGTKWDAKPDDMFFSIDEDSMEIYFDTAWGPPIKFYEELFERFNFEVNATFVEQGANYIGYYVNGDYQVEDFISDGLDYDDEDYYEKIDERLESYFENTNYAHPATPNHTGG